MKVKVIGYRALDFQSKDGQQIKGTQVFATYPSTDQYVKGECVLLKEDNYKNKKLPFVPSNICPNVDLGEYDVSFDINGGIVSFVKVK